MKETSFARNDYVLMLVSKQNLILIEEENKPSE